MPAQQDNTRTQVEIRSDLVTIILPCYNVASFLPDALESLIAQTYDTLEILVVDDGSVDGTAAVAKEFAARDSRIRLLQKANGGLASARNFGLDQTHGKFVAFLDGDDFWHPHKVECHLRHFSDNPHLGVSYSGTRFVNLQGKPLRHVRRPKIQAPSNYYLYCRNPITNGSNAIFLREIYDHHRFDETLERAQDIDCWLRIAFAPPARWGFGGIARELTFYRVNGAGLSNDYSDHYACAKRVWEKSKSYAPAIAARFASLAEAYQLRFYARRAIASKDTRAARKYLVKALTKDPRIVIRDPFQTATTAVASLMPVSFLRALTD